MGLSEFAGDGARTSDVLSTGGRKSRGGVGTCGVSVAVVVISSCDGSAEWKGCKWDSGGLAALSRHRLSSQAIPAVGAASGEPSGVTGALAGTRLSRGPRGVCAVISLLHAASPDTGEA